MLYPAVGLGQTLMASRPVVCLASEAHRSRPIVQSQASQVIPCLVGLMSVSAPGALPWVTFVSSTQTSCTNVCRYFSNSSSFFSMNLQETVVQCYLKHRRGSARALSPLAGN